MGCFSGGVKGQSVQQVPTLTGGQRDVLDLLASRVAPAVKQVPTKATVPPMQFAPGGPSSLQQQAFGLAGRLPNYLQGPAFGQFDPNQILSAMSPVGNYAQQMFQQETIPSIMGAMGYGGTARSSGAADILGREGRNLSLGLASQFAPMQYQGLQDQLTRQAMLPGLAGEMTGQMAGLGQLQRAIPEESRQYELSRFMAAMPEASPALQFLGPLLGTSAYDTAVQQGFYYPGVASQFLGALGSGIGSYYGAKSDERLKEDIKPIENALDKVEQLDGKVYKFKFKETERDGGVIAQDLEKVLPEAVVEKGGVKYVKYEAVIALLVNAVKELSRKVG